MRTSTLLASWILLYPIALNAQSMDERIPREIGQSARQYRDAAEFAQEQVFEGSESISAIGNAVLKEIDLFFYQIRLGYEGDHLNRAD